MTRLYGLDVQTSVTQIPLSSATLEGLLSIPDGARSIIVFAQGRGSCRNNAIDTFLATQLQHAGYATLLPDLYTPQELQQDMQDAHVRFNVRMLGERLTGVADWLVHHAATRHMTVGLLGASTGAAAAITTGANRPETTSAIVCRAGRPDLAGSALGYLHAPTLLLVGENDPVVISFNEQAADQMPHVHKLILVPNAGHEFQEPGALEQMAAHALQWFSGHLVPNRAL
jgi:putative phosphoribosyl transferase